MIFNARCHVRLTRMALFHQGTTHGYGEPDSAQSSVAYNDLNILDTDSWTWLPPKWIRGEPPKPRYDAAAGVLLEKYWVILGGMALAT